MKKFLVLILSTIFILGACGQSKSDKKGKTVSFTDEVNKGNHVLLLYKDSNDDIDEDQYLEGLASIKEGKITLYNLRDKKLSVSDAEKKSDKELVELGEKEDKKAFDDGKKDAIKLYKDMDDSGDKDLHKESEKQLAKVKKLNYKKPESQILTTEKESEKGKTKSLRIKTSNYDDVDSTMTDYETYLNEEFNTVCKPKKVGSTKMIGVVNKTGSEDNVHAIMRGDDNTDKVTL